MNTSNPYEAPRATLEEPQAEDGGFLGEPRAVSLGAGGDWLGAGFRMFGASPGTWIAAVIVLSLAMALPQLVRFLSLFVTLLTPVLLAGVFLACDGQRRSGQLDIGLLFGGFSRNLPQLLLLGVLNLVVALVSMAVMYAGMYGPDQAVTVLVTVLGGGQPPLPAGGMQFGRFFAAWAVLVVAMVPVSMAMWLAPALVAINGQSAAQALRLSFVACGRSFFALFVYVLMLFALGIAATLPLLLGWIVVGPVMLAASYAAYRDFFYEPAA